MKTFRNSKEGDYHGTLSKKGDRVSVILDVSHIDRAEKILGG